MKRAPNIAIPSGGPAGPARRPEAFPRPRESAFAARLASSRCHKTDITLNVPGDGEGHTGRLLYVLRSQAIPDLMEFRRAESESLHLLKKRPLACRIDDRIRFEELSAPFPGVGSDHPAEDYSPAAQPPTPSNTAARWLRCPRMRQRLPSR